MSSNFNKSVKPCWNGVQCRNPRCNFWHGEIATTGGAAAYEIVAPPKKQCWNGEMCQNPRCKFEHTKSAPTTGGAAAKVVAPSKFAKDNDEEIVDQYGQLCDWGNSAESMMASNWIYSMYEQMCAKDPELSIEGAADAIVSMMKAFPGAKSMEVMMSGMPKEMVMSAIAWSIDFEIRRNSEEDEFLAQLEEHTANMMAAARDGM